MRAEDHKGKRKGQQKCSTLPKYLICSSPSVELLSFAIYLEIKGSIHENIKKVQGGCFRDRMRRDRA